MYSDGLTKADSTVGHDGLRGALANGGCAFGAWMSLDSEGVPGILDRAGYHFIGFDCQHGAFGEADAARHVRRMANTRAAAIVRVSANSPALIGKVLDAGADGVIVPMVNTAEEAAQAVAACRYAPHGVRSFGPNRADLPMTARELESRVSCFVMIETREGVANAKTICATPGLAGIVIGPGDLSVSLGLDPLDGFRTDQIFESLAVIRNACEANSITLGIFAGSATGSAKWIAQGVRMLIIGSDIGLLGQAASLDIAEARAQMAEALPAK